MNKVKKMVSGGLILVLLGSMFLAGPGVLATDKVVLTYASWFSGGRLISEKALAEVFSKKYPNIEIKRIITPWPQHHTKLLTMVAGGTAPDLMIVDAYFGEEFFLKNAFMDLEPYIDRSGISLDLYFPGLIQENSREGKLYGIPYVWGTIAVGINRDLFEKAGLDYPGPDSNWTWDDFLDLGKKLTKDINGDGMVDQFGVTYADPWSKIFSEGGDIFNEDYTECTLDEPAAYEAIQWVADLANLYHVAPSRAEASAFGRLGADNMFQAGQIGMAMTWDGNVLVWTKQAKFDLSMAPVPAGKLGSIVRRKGNCLGVSSLAKHPEEAWKYLEFILSEETQEMFMELDLIPLLMSLAKSDEFLFREEPPYDLSPAMNANVRWIRYFVGLRQALNDGLDLVHMGKAKAKDVFQTVASELDKMLTAK